MNEEKIKSVVLQELRNSKLINKRSIIASEYTLGRLGRRIDLAIWNGQFVGIEIKSSLDTLARLQEQLDTYDLCFDRIYLVVDQKHLLQAMQISAQHVEIWSIDKQGCITKLRGGLENPNLDKAARLKLLKQTHLRKISKVPVSKTVSQANIAEIAYSLSTDDISSTLVGYFKETHKQTSHEFWQVVGRKKIRDQHLSKLSRFLAAREQNQYLKNKQEAFWEEWKSKAELAFTA